MEQYMVLQTDNNEFSYEQYVNINKNSFLNNAKDIHTISLFEDNPDTYSVEAFKSLLPPNIRPGRIFKFRNINKEPFKQLLLLKRLNGVAFIPIVSNTFEVMDEVIQCFGSNNYQRMMLNYIYPKLFQYKNPYVPGSKLIKKRNDMNQYITEVKSRLPKLLNPPSYIIRNIKNSIIDISKIIDLTYPSIDMLKRPSILQIAESIPIQMISRIGFKIMPEHQPLYTPLKLPLPPASEIFDSIIFSIRVKTNNVKVATQFLNAEQKIPLSIKRNPDSIFILGLMRFILKIIDNNFLEYSDLESRLYEEIKQKNHVVFLFHNDTHAFYLDPVEIKNREIRYETIYSLVRLSLKILISLNNKSLNPLDVDVENEISPEELEREIDSKIQINNDVIDKASSEVSGIENEDVVINGVQNKIDEILLPKNNSPNKKFSEDADEKSVDKIKHTIAQGRANILRQKSLGINILEKNKKIDEINYDEKDSLDLNSLQEAFEDEEEEFYNEIEDYPDIVNGGEDIDEEKEDKEDAKDFLNELKSANDEESQKKFLEEIKLSSSPALSPAEKRRLDALHNKYKSIKFTGDKTFEQILSDTTTQTIDINKSGADIKDDSFNYSILKDFTSSYIKKTLNQDILKTIKFFSEDKSINMHIIDYDKKDSSDQLNKVTTHIFTLEDDHEQKHRIRFKLPDIDEDGFMFINGNKKFLKKQLVLRPVTKTKEDEVYLTSDLNKVRLYRQGTVLNRNVIIIKKIIRVLLDNLKKENFKGELSKNVTILRGNNSLANNDYITTIEYDELASYLHYFTLHPNKADQVTFYFNQVNIREEISKYNIDYKYSPQHTPIGIDFGSKKAIDVNSIDSTDSVAAKIINYIIKSGAVPDIDAVIKSTSIPKRKMYSRIEIQSKDTPLIVFLSSLFTYTKVIEKSGIKTYFVKNGENMPSGVKVNELIPVTFADGVLYYYQYPIENSLLLNGLGELNTLEIEYEELDNTATYLDWIYDNFKTRNLYKGWTAFHELFLNPKTVECLEALNQPTDFLELFLYANGLLSNNTYLNSADAGNWRIRDYEMINSMLYEAISKEYRVYKQKGKSREGFSVPENEVMKMINKSFVISGYDATNPLNELRERSSITYKGPKGINSSRALSLEKRGQTRSTTGTIGISSIDNGNVGIVKQLTVNPRIINTLGFIDSPSKDGDVDKIPTSSLMTAEESMLPFVNHDDPKRIGFASGQTKHVIPSNHFTPQVIGTGFEQSVVYKIGNDFGYKASGDGQVLAVNENDKFAVIKYKDGKTVRIEYGERYHRNSDFFLANNLALAVKEGEFFKSGQLLTYNKDFFKKHLGKLMYSQGVVARVAVTEGEVTEEDSSAITQRLANKLNSTVIKRNQIVVGIKSNIIRSAEIGDHVIYGDPLLVFEDQKDNDSDLSVLDIFGDTNEKILDDISRHKASAGYTGEIIDIKVYWTVSPEFMSESCALFVKKYIKKIKKQISFEESASKTNSNKNVEIMPSSPILDRINGMSIPRDGGILVEYFIKHSTSKRSGDKVTLNSSLKSVLCQIIPDDLAPRRLNGRFKQIDMIFSFIGINARQVTSIWFTGFISKIIVEEGEKFAGEFFAEIGEDPYSINESSLTPLAS
jgi:hypothetical protein